MVSPPAVIVGAIITVIFGFLWARDVMSPGRAPAAGGPEPAGTADAEPIPAHMGAPATPPGHPSEGPASYPRSKFLELGTLGLGAVIGGIITAPILGFAVLPAFTEDELGGVDLGPLTKYPTGKWIEATFLLNPAAGEVSRRTAFIRSNGMEGGQPSMTIISNRCVHLGCPVQAAGPRNDDQQETIKTEQAELTVTPVLPANFSCPCHGGSYDTEGNRIAGPPVRALDRFKYSIVDGHLILLQPYSVSEVEGEGAKAAIKAYGIQGPGEHVDGLSGLLYPIQPQDLG